MSGSRDRRARLRAACWRTSLLAIGWWALLETERGPAVAFGVVVVLLGALASMALSVGGAEVRVRPVACVRLAWLFVAASVGGGWDVALRALSPRLRLAPVVFRYSTRQVSGPAQKLFTTLVTLPPGTMTVDTSGRDVWIHALVDRGEPMRASLEALETSVARAVGASAPRDGGADA
jgi:multicomponent Na+:H+ antiporter subunit E